MLNFIQKRPTDFQLTFNELQDVLEKPLKVCVELDENGKLIAINNIESLTLKTSKKMTKNQKILAAVKRAMCEKTMLTSTNIEEVVKQVSADLPPTTPWWVIVLKVLAYAIGLLLAGYGTATAATLILPWMR